MDTLLLNPHVAGIFDGEGTFMVTRRYRSYTRTKVVYDAVAVLSIREPIITDSLKHTFGGSTYHNTSRETNHNDIWRWSLTGKGLVDFIEEVLPFLIIKTDQANKVLELQRRKTANIKVRSLSTKEQEWRNLIYLEVRELNRRGTKALNVVPLDEFIKNDRRAP